MTNAEIHLRAHWVIKTLKERQRAFVKVHTDMVRELRNIADEAELAAHGGQDSELIKLECVSSRSDQNDTRRKQSGANHGAGLRVEKAIFRMSSSETLLSDALVAETKKRKEAERFALAWKKVAIDLANELNCYLPKPTGTAKLAIAHFNDLSEQTAHRCNKELNTP